MTSVKINKAQSGINAPTASEEIVSEANRIVTVTDRLGRKIAFRKPSVSLLRRVYKAISADNSEKPRYIGLVNIAACCASINGEMIPTPTSEIGFDALIDRLGDDGMEAIGLGIVEHFPTPETQEALAALAKNS